jgi:hypothetical protein
MDTAEPRQKKTGRPAWSYRGARKKAEREQDAIKRRHLPDVVFDGSFDGSIELNRADRWSRAKDYSYAREIGPSKEPVR